MKRPDSSTSPKRSFSSGMSGAYCALTSTSGVVGTGPQPVRAAAEEQPRRSQHDHGDHSVVNPTEILVYPPVAGSDTPAGAREGETPDRRSDQRQDRVPQERRAEDAGGDRDERPDDGREAAEKHGPVAAPVEPGLGAVEPLRCEVEPASARSEEHTSELQSDSPAGERSEQVADRAGEGDGDEAPGVGVDPAAEEHDVMLCVIDARSTGRCYAPTSAGGRSARR